MSITKLLLLIVGAVCLIIGVGKLIVVPISFTGILFPLLLIVVGFVLLTGRGISL